MKMVLIFVVHSLGFLVEPFPQLATTHYEDLHN